MVSFDSERAIQSLHARIKDAFDGQIISSSTPLTLILRIAFVCLAMFIMLQNCEGGKIRAKIGPVYTDPDLDPDQDPDKDPDLDPDPDPDKDQDQDLDPDKHQHQDLDPDLDKEIFCLRDRFISYYIQIV